MRAYISSIHIIISILYLHHTQRAFIAQSSNTERDQHVMTTPSDVMVVKRHATLGSPQQLLPSAINVLSRSSRFHSVPRESYLTVLSCFEQSIYVLSLLVSEYCYYRYLLIHCEPDSLENRASILWQHYQQHHEQCCYVCPF